MFSINMYECYTIYKRIQNNELEEKGYLYWFMFKRG